MKAMTAEAIKWLVEGKKDINDMEASIKMNAEQWNRLYGDNWSVFKTDENTLAIQLGGSDVLFVRSGEFFKWTNNGIQRM